MILRNKSRKFKLCCKVWIVGKENASASHAGIVSLLFQLHQYFTTITEYLSADTTCFISRLQSHSASHTASLLPFLTVGIDEIQVILREVV